MSKTEQTEIGFALMEELTSESFVAAARASSAPGNFCSELAQLGARHAFAEHWSRPGLDRRSRSLLTLGILIGSGHSSELRYHIRIALKNGITVREIEEMIYQATAYAGFPAAVQAAQAAREELKALNMI